MRIEGDSIVFSVLPVTEAPLSMWKHVLEEKVFEDAQVSADGPVLEITIKPGREITTELIRGIEKKMRAHVGQVLQN